MNEMHLSALSLGSFVKLNLAIWTAAGTVLGVVAFFASLLGLEVTATFLSSRLTGVPAGAAAIILAPLVLAVFSVLASAIAYLPFRWWLFFSGGITLSISGSAVRV